jgi:hypothetical protein
MGQDSARVSRGKWTVPFDNSNLHNLQCRHTMHPCARPSFERDPPFACAGCNNNLAPSRVVSFKSSYSTLHPPCLCRCPAHLAGLPACLCGALHILGGQLPGSSLGLLKHHRFSPKDAGPDCCTAFCKSLLNSPSSSQQRAGQAAT